MDMSVLVYVVSGLVSLAVALGWRQLAKSDTASNKKDESVDAAFAEHRAREEKMREELAELRLQMAYLVKREEMQSLLKNIYDKIDDVKTNVMNALAHRGS